jgi:hypothetical protein
VPNPAKASQDPKDDNVGKEPSREELTKWILSILPEPPNSKHGDNSPSNKRKTVAENKRN